MDQLSKFELSLVPGFTKWFEDNLSNIKDCFDKVAQEQFDLESFALEIFFESQP